MSQSAVIAYVRTKCAAISGIKSVKKAAPKKPPTTLASYPLMIAELLPAATRPLTFGKTEVSYNVLLTIWLGPKEMDADDAQEQLEPYSDRLREAFAPDHTLGGNCLFCNLTAPGDNLATYLAQKSHPKVQWALRVQEHVTDNAVAP